MGTETELGFDPAALRERYRLERDKRLRPDGNDQYVQPTGELGHLVVDPHADPEFRRPALTDEVDVVVCPAFTALRSNARL